MARNAILQVRHDTHANWEISTLILADGEMAYTTDTHILKVGDGTKTWSELQIVSGLPAGGGDNYVLVKASNADFDVEWSPNIPVTSATVDSLYFNTSAGITVNTIGQLAWDAAAGAVDIQLNDGVTQHIGQEVYYRVKADENIVKGDLVMAVGTVGNSGLIKVAKSRTSYGALTNIQSQRLMGLAASNITNGNEGYIVHFGKLRKVDTEQWSAGDILYADPTVPGGLTNVSPVAPNWKTIVALVITDHKNVGELFIRPTFGSQLTNDESVTITNPQDGNVLTYQSGVWVNGSGGNSADSILANQVFG